MPKKVKGKTSLQRLASCGTHVFAKAILVAGNVCSFALAAGLVAVGAKQVNYGQLRAVLDGPSAQRTTPCVFFVDTLSQRLRSDTCCWTRTRRSLRLAPC